VTQLMARMAEMVASRSEGDVLVALGLGSCIGLALVDGGCRAAALAHIVLPTASRHRPAAAAKYADTAVPALVNELEGLGVRHHSIGAVIVGGARMFSMGGGMDIGSRNEAAVRDALRAARIPLLGSITGGSVGRTIRVHVGDRWVSYKEAGGPEVNLLAAGAAVAA
jgi:chemotaxis protein CheD